jgi:hypothetical protein
MVDFSRVSPEILRNVFLHFVDLPRHHFRDIPMPGLYRSKDTFSTPLLLSHICSSWRRVACSSPMLWSLILLHRPSEKHIPLLKLWLLRSRDAPLTLHLQSMAPDQSIPQHQILRLLLPHSWRWKHFFVEIHGLHESLCFSSELASFLASRTYKFPDLEGLVIKFPPHPQKHLSLPIQLCNLLYDIPSLFSVLMPFPCLKYHTNLTAIICDNALTFDLILCTLTCCPNLTSIDVRLDSHIPHPHLATGTVEHHNLSNLRILDPIDGPQNSTSLARRLLLNNLTVTNLAILDIDCNADDIRAIHNMILRSNCNMRSLSKLRLVGPCEQVNRLLRLPQLHHLQQLGLRGANREILELLTQGSNGTIKAILPSLKFLDVQDLLVPVGSALSDLLLSRFDSLKVATVTAGDCIWHTPLAKKLWSHPGYQIVAKGKKKNVDILEGRKDSPDLSYHREYVHHSWQPCARSDRC